MDANLHHDLVTGKAVTAILHMLNATPVHWHGKRQLTFETATFGSEFVSAGTAVDQIIDICLTLMYLGVPINARATCSETTRQWSPMPPSLFPPSPKDPMLLPITEFKKQLQEAISNFIGGMANPTLQTSLANTGDLQMSHLFYSPFFSGEEIVLTLPPNQRGVTGFQLNILKSEGSLFDSVPS